MTNDESEQIPAGWYPSPSGGKRYWDGQHWLALPDPDETPPHGSPPGRPPGGSRNKLIGAALGVTVVVAAAIGGLVWKSKHDEQMQNKAAAAASASAQAEAEAADAAERSRRASAVVSLENSVKKLAVEHVSKGLFDGPVLSVDCVPVDGGSTDDLTERTTVFECFAATKDNGDGTLRGRVYNGTMNWTTGEYTYGLGAP